MRLQTFLITLSIILVGCLTSTTAAAQDGSEHRYEFQCQGLETPGNEKVFCELLMGFDPHMRISYDRELAHLRVLAYLPLDVNEVLALAEQVGVTLVPRRTPILRADLSNE